MEYLLWLINDPFFWLVIGSSIWVVADAKSIGVRKGQIKGLFDMGPWGWFLICLLLWIIGFPIYLVKRSEYRRINGWSTAHTYTYYPRRR